MNKELLAKYNLKDNDLILFRIVNHHRLEFELGKKLSDNILDDTIIKIEEDLKKVNLMKVLNCMQLKKKI